jgi:hypothetical protein
MAIPTGTRINDPKMIARMMPNRRRSYGDELLWVGEATPRTISWNREEPGLDDGLGAASPTCTLPKLDFGQF